MKNKRSKLLEPVINFFKSDSANGLILFSFAILAMIVANSGLAEPYNHLLHQQITLGFGQWSLSMSLLHWINGGLFEPVSLKIIFGLIVGKQVGIF